MRVGTFTDGSEYANTPEGLHLRDDLSGFLVGGIVPVADDRVREMSEQGAVVWDSAELAQLAMRRLSRETVPVSAPAVVPAQPPIAATPAPVASAPARAAGTRSGVGRRVLLVVVVLLVLSGVGFGGWTAYQLGQRSAVDDAQTAEKTTGEARVMGDDETAEAPAAEAAAEPAPTAEGSGKVSQAAIDYARDLGGKSHKGETLYIIIGASGSPEDFMQFKLDDAVPYFGDMQSYFIVQSTDNFEGLEPGMWFVGEAYATQADAEENLDFANRGFADANGGPYIKRVVVKTDDPIPVNYVDVNLKE